MIKLWNTTVNLSIRLNTLGENHPDVASSYNNIGEVYTNKHELDKALEYYNKSLSIKINTFGENHINSAIGYANLGELYAT